MRFYRPSEGLDGVGGSIPSLATSPNFQTGSKVCKKGASVAWMESMQAVALSVYDAENVSWRASSCAVCAGGLLLLAL